MEDFQKQHGVKFDYMNERTINQYLAWKRLQDDKHELKPLHGGSNSLRTTGTGAFGMKKSTMSKKDMGVEMSMYSENEKLITREGSKVGFGRDKIVEEKKEYKLK